MVGGPDPVRLPTAGVSPWGRWPRYHAQDASSDKPRHHPGPGDQSDDDPGPDDDDACRHGPDENCWRDNCHAIRDREEPGHLNRQA